MRASIEFVARQGDMKAYRPEHSTEVGRPHAEWR